MEQTLEQLAALFKGQVIGDGKTRIRGVSNLDHAHAGEIAFAEGAKQLAAAATSKASALIVEASVRDLGGRPGISVKNPRLAFAQALELFHPDPAPTPGVHPTAVLGTNVKLGDGVAIGALSVIGDGVTIGRGTVIESGVHVGAGCAIGEQCFLAPTVVLYRNSRVGNRVRLHSGVVIGGDGFGYIFDQGRFVKIPQVGNAVIEDDVEIGANACVDRATVKGTSTTVGQGTKVDNQAQIAHNDQIGKHAIIAGQVGLAGSVTIGDFAMLGGKVGVIDHITIGAQAKIGAGSVVMKDVPAKSFSLGFPATDAVQAKRQFAAIVRLPNFMRKVAKRFGMIEQTESSDT